MAHIPNIKREVQNEYTETISIQENNVIWHYGDVVCLQFDLREVVIIGEYTTEAGPWFDDWFLTFVTKDGLCFPIPFYAYNIQGLLNELGERFDSDLKKSALANSASWKSVVRYPIHVKGYEFLKKVPSKNFKPPKNFFQKVLYSLGMGGFNIDEDLELTDLVKAELLIA